MKIQGNNMKKLSIIFLLILMSSCDSNNNNTQLIGEWSTESCEQAGSPLGSYEGLWARGNYEFEITNTIKTSYRFYTDSSCTIGEIVFNPENTGPSLPYVDLGEVTLQEGIQGHQFNLIYQTDVVHTFEGFYTITNSRLCFSDNINFDPFSINSSEGETTSIDFEKCLVKN